jgi:hypothetical protein
LRVARSWIATALSAMASSSLRIGIEGQKNKNKPCHFYGAAGRWDKNLLDGSRLQPVKQKMQKSFPFLWL